jgi:hypothetical protein
MSNHQPTSSRGAEVTFDGAVEVAVVTFLAHRQAGDDVIFNHLRRAGVEDWLAERLIAFLPVAFGRTLLRGVALSNSLSENGADRPLDTEPVFLAAQARAQRATREEVESIGLRSSEVNAVNSLLQKDKRSRLEHLVLSPVTLVSPLTPSLAGHGGIPSPRQAFAECLTGHGYEVDARADGLYCGPLHFDARVIPHTPRDLLTVQVDFAVQHPMLVMPWLIESFAGMGRTWREAIGQAIDKFQQASLHVLIAALLDRRACADQVSWEPLVHPAGAFDLCIGPQLLSSTPGPIALGPLLDSLKRALAGAPLARSVHAVRIYVARDGDKTYANEVLLDNAPWEAGVVLVASYPWPRLDRFWATRLFLLMVPA